MEYQLIHPRRPGTSAIEQVLLNRGIEDVHHYLNTTTAYILSPLGLDNIKEGAKLLVSHISKKSKILVIVDSDCDGYTSAAVLLNYLNNLFPAFTQNNIIYKMHSGKQHGIVLSMVPSDVNLVICPDSSSEDYEQHEILKSQGIDVLVIDHHEASKVSENACVINNQLCNYDNKFLSGVGVVYKFCSYIDSQLGTDHADKYLDLVALGLVADMMDLRPYETKQLIQMGLKNINNPYFKGMTIKNEYSLGGNITPFGVAFYIAPYINAVTRSGTMEEKMVLFESMLEFKAYEQIPSTKRGHKGEYETIVEQACRSCTNVKNRQTKVRDTSLELIEGMIANNNLLDNKVVAILLTAEQKTTLGGLIANQLMNTYQKPFLILSETEHDDEIWYEGSFRGPNVPGLESAKEFFEGTGYAEYTAGHANAGGVGIKKDNIENFISYCNNALADMDFTPVYKVDFVFDAKTIHNDRFDFYNLIDYSDLWGQEVTEPLVVIKDLTITQNNITLMRGTTIKIEIPNETDISLIKFKSNEQEFEVLCPPSSLGCVTIDVVGNCVRNTWDNKPQIIIKDYIVKDRQEYYF
jgi:single-stranded-DNA-specific exonuclease